jgi:hypothetical protein
MDILTESPEDKTAFDAIRTEQAIPEPEKKPEDAPLPEAKPAEQAKSEEKKPVRLVPHEALHEERVKRQALERRLAEIEAAKPKPEAPKPIDETQDPIGALAELRQRLQTYEEREQKQREAFQQEQEFGRRIKSRVDAYAKDHPEYLEQVNHLRQSRAAELRLLGHTDDMIAVQIMQEERALGAMALEKDLDPGEIVANLAKHRGWAPKQPEVKADEGKPALPDPSEAVKAAILESTAKIDRMEKGQKAAKSSSAGGGGGPTPELTLEQIAELDGAAFDAAFGKVRGLMA